MKTFWTVCDKTGKVVVENIYDYHAAHENAERLVTVTGQIVIIKEYGLKSESVFTPKSERTEGTE